MLQERIEGKWLASFRRVMTLNGIGNGTRAVLICETQSRPVLAHLAELALYELGADFCMLKIREESPLPDVRFECLKDTGHVCNIESPDNYNQPLLELVRRVTI